MSETLEAVLARHRCGHNPATGAARCACGWVGPYTRLPGSDMGAHLADVVREWVAGVLASLEKSGDVAATLARIDAAPLRPHEGARVLYPRKDLATAALAAVREALTGRGVAEGGEA